MNYFIAIMIYVFANGTIETVEIPVIADDSAMCLAWVEGGYGQLQTSNGRKVVNKKASCYLVRGHEEFMDIRGQMEWWKERQP